MENKIPTEDEIEEFLRAVRPLPNPGYHQKMAKKPWNTTGRVPFLSSKIFIRTAISLGIILTLAILLNILSPSLNTMAQRFTIFFLPASSDLADTAILALETSHPQERFDLTIDQAEEIFGYAIKFPIGIPEEFKLKGIAYDNLREAVILNYITDSRGLVLRVSMQKADADYQRIGPGAVVEFVKIGNYTGEYVSGGWTIPEVESEIDNSRNPSIPQAYWKSNVNLQTLRWSDGEFLYEIILAGGNEQTGYLDKKDLIALAERMQ